MGCPQLHVLDQEATALLSVDLSVGPRDAKCTKQRWKVQDRVRATLVTKEFSPHIKVPLVAREGQQRKES